MGTFCHQSRGGSRRKVTKTSRGDQQEKEKDRCLHLLPQPGPSSQTALPATQLGNAEGKAGGRVGTAPRHLHRMTLHEDLLCRDFNCALLGTGPRPPAPLTSSDGTSGLQVFGREKADPPSPKSSLQSSEWRGRWDVSLPQLHLVSQGQHSSTW